MYMYACYNTYIQYMCIHAPVYINIVYTCTCMPVIIRIYNTCVYMHLCT